MSNRKKNNLQTKKLKKTKETSLRKGTKLTKEILPLRVGWGV